MTMGKVGMSVVLMVSVLILSGGMAYSDDAPPPLPTIPADYADKHMPAGGWTDPKAIAEGAKIFTGEANPLVNCGSCHGKDGQPVKKGARDLRDPKNTTRFSDSFLVLASVGRGPEDEDEGLEAVPVGGADLAGYRLTSTSSRTRTNQPNTRITNPKQEENPIALIRAEFIQYVPSR